MKYAFVRYDVNRKVADGGTSFHSVLIKGEASETRESCQRWIEENFSPNGPVRILYRFEVPEVWTEDAGEFDGCLNSALDAVTGLDALTNSPLASDLLGAIFMAGFTCGMRFDSELQSAFYRGGAAKNK
ncbi:MAG: hypothetical protein O3B64_02160 [bacterium]|nr:hypothetical protein [bacterium]